MELIEPIEYINGRLLREFGREFNGWAKFRVVWSDDQLEKRWVQQTDEGFDLLVPEVRERPKYRQHIQQKWILERLLPVPAVTDLVDNISYEPAWVFQDDGGNYLPPRYDACKFVIEAIYAQMDDAGTHKKYKDPAAEKGYRKQLVDDMEKELFGNETSVGDALTYKEGVTVPGMPEYLAEKLKKSEG